MTKFRAASVLGLLALVPGGCSTTPEVTQAPVARQSFSQSNRLGAGDAIGRRLNRSDKAIAGAEMRDRTLASHPED